MVTQNVAQSPLHHVTNAPTEFEVTTSKGFGEIFTRKFNIWPLILGPRAQYPLHHVTYPATKFEVTMSNHLGGDTFTNKKHYLILDLGAQGHTKCCQYLLHHVTYSATKFEVATSNGLEGDAFTRKFNIWPLTLGSRPHEMLPSTLYIMWPIQLQSFKLLPLTV